MYLLGIDIGGTKCAVVLAKGVSANGIICEGIADRYEFETMAAKRGPDSVLEELAFSAEKIFKRNFIRAIDIAKIGISCGGPLDSERGIIKSPPNLPGWDDVHIKEFFEKRFYVPVYLQNDANACALAEHRFGAGKGYKNVIFLTCGTGMGAGIIINGELYTGRNDMAGEVGHISLSEQGPLGYGKRGSFEGYCSGNGIANLAFEKLKEWTKSGNKSSLSANLEKGELSAKAVFEAMYAGDELAKRVMTTSAEFLGKGIAVLADILNPEIVIIGSIFTRNADFYLPIVTETVKREALRECSEDLKIVPSMLGDSIGDYAALGIIVDNIELTDN
ncbi:MAG: Glucokinase [Firmicutes bacterium ADurb.Bin300]|nr:MAG: Glucokinase [Firmicutes bacterium ADurb.Bin300]HOD01775.1 ROK family protein [Clostridiales bacterium]